ncbi:hypothetical protein [Niabella hibiscisoli]|uniref:hypothetical protein n=1 Tax=Niabella hibiscisoli TaxID=1825928 RepID=UPI001F0F9156|nr:hypothetical protein [Niabella hibiscisoli]MCH5719489.1 hypothetical protein [Niabella hibiscisoli]
MKNELAKYNRLILVAHPEAVHAKLVAEGFLHYCTETEFQYLIQSEIDEKISE